MASAFRKTLKSVRARSRRIDVVFQYIGYTVILLYFFFVVSVWLSSREAVRIDNVEILGAHAVDAGRITIIASDALNKKLLWKIGRNNAILYPKYQMVKNIYLLDGRVKSVSIKVISRKNLTITVEEYAPKLLACPSMAITSTSSAACYFGDDEGYIFAHSPEYSGYFLPIFITHDGVTDDGNIIGTHVLPESEFVAIQRFLNALKSEGFTPKMIDYLGEHDYEIMTEQAWSILWSSTVSPTESVNNLRLVLRSMTKDGANSAELKKVDLRFGNKIFYQ